MKKIILLLGFSALLWGAHISQTLQENSLVIYNANIGLVHEKRELTLNKDDTNIIYEDIALSLEVDSLDVTLPKGVTLYSQQYKHKTLTKEQLLSFYTSKNVQVQSENGRLLEVKLLSHSGAEVLLQRKDGKVFFSKSAHIIFDALPKEFLNKPSLVLNIQTKRSVHDFIELEYLVNNLSFQANYTLKLQNNTADMLGWITIKNHSGKTFRDTKLSLVAGAINTTSSAPVLYRSKNLAMMDAPPLPQQQSFEGYHLYSIPFKVTLTNNETTQIKFLQEKKIKVLKSYESRMPNPLYMQAFYENDVTQLITLKNPAKPLPKGLVRIYSKQDEQNILIAQSSIKHTPKNKELTLTLGKTFDLKATAKVLQRENSKHIARSSIMYTVENFSDDDASVNILVPFNKERSSRIKTTQKYRFTKGNLATFTLKVKANSSESFQVNYESKH